MTPADPPRVASSSEAQTRHEEERTGERRRLAHRSACRRGGREKRVHPPPPALNAGILVDLRASISLRHVVHPTWSSNMRVRCHGYPEAVAGGGSDATSENPKRSGVKSTLCRLRGRDLCFFKQYSLMAGPSPTGKDESEPKAMVAADPGERRGESHRSSADGTRAPQLSLSLSLPLPLLPSRVHQYLLTPGCALIHTLSVAYAPLLYLKSPTSCTFDFSNCSFGLYRRPNKC